MGNYFSRSSDISDQDIIVIVMGQAGAGKSSFINTAAGSKLPVGHKLQPCTMNVRSVISVSPDDSEGRRVVFVDTPAFDIDLDHKGERNIKKKFEKWQKRASAQNNVIAGIIYLHKISEPRMSEPPLKRLRTFEKLCGGDLPEKVLLVTTMWCHVDPAMGLRREEELRKKYWKLAKTNRPNMARFEDTADAAQAWNAVDLLLERCNGKTS